jgi:hypothetical protein
MSRHLVELGVSIEVARNEWGQIVIDLKSKEGPVLLRLNNRLQVEVGTQVTEPEDPARTE